jgi:CDP-paratose 2-epimerase
MKVLITGGCGFLGSNLAASYLKDGSDVVIVDALFRKGSAENLKWLAQQAAPSALQFEQLDLASAEAVNSVFRRYGPFNYICHAGGQVAMTSSLQDPARDLQTNVVGTFNVLEAARALSPDALIAYSSTNKVYGDLKHLRYEETPSRYLLADFPDGLDETLPLDFSTPYGCSKGAADQYVRDWARVYGMKTVVFRHSSIYGGRQFATYDQGWVGWFCRKGIEHMRAFHSNTPPEIFTISGTGKQVRDVLHADDLVRLYRLAYERRELLNGEIFNIGGGIASSLSLLELFDIIAEILDIPSMRYENIPRRASDQDFFVASIAKVNRILDWEPSISCKHGIAQMLQWTEEQMHPKS